MGLRGVIAQPTAVKALRGNPGRRALNESEAKPLPLVSLAAPDRLGDIGKQVWNRNIPELNRLKLISKLDWEAFFRYCWTSERWYDAKENVDKFGAVFPKRDASGKVISMVQNPYVWIERSYSQELMKLEASFGMNPSARSRIRVDEANGDNGDDDPFA